MGYHQSSPINILTMKRITKQILVAGTAMTARNASTAGTARTARTARTAHYAGNAMAASTAMVARTARTAGGARTAHGARTASTAMVARTAQTRCRITEDYIMKLLNITNAVNRGKLISGIYEQCSPWRAESWSGRPRDGKVGININGKEVNVWVNKNDCTVAPPNSTVTATATATTRHAKAAYMATVETIDVRSNEQIGLDISERFSAMNTLTSGVLSGAIRSVIISGAPGVGKSYELINKLDIAEQAGKVDYVRVSGAISGIGLYKTLYNYRNKNCVVVLDDVDRIFADEDALNVLKAALDTNKKRTITWMTETRALKDDDIPTSFEFAGAVVFITNMHFDKMIAGGSKIAPHINALMSRSIYLDLGIHTNREIMIRIEQVISNGDIFEKDDLCLTKSQKTDIIQWVRDNHHHMRSLSLREVLHLGSMVVADSKNWKQLAAITQLRRTRSFI